MVITLSENLDSYRLSVVGSDSRDTGAHGAASLHRPGFSTSALQLHLRLSTVPR